MGIEVLVVKIVTEDKLSEEARAYLCCYRRLMELCATDKDESPEAEQMREGMDAYWYGMMPGETAVVEHIMWSEARRK